MTVAAEPQVDRVPMSRSQQNMYNGAVQAGDPGLYLIGKSFRFHPIELPAFLSALEGAVAANPLQLCVLEPAQESAGYPELVRHLQFSDIASVAPDQDDLTARTAEQLVSLWSGGLTTKPLVRYTVRTGPDGQVVGLDIQAHHLLFDGGAIGVIEADLGRRLSEPEDAETAGVGEGLTRIAAAHSREAAKAEESLRRFGAAIQSELAEAARHRGYGQGSGGTTVGAAKGVLLETVTLSGKAFDAIDALAEAKQIPLNILVAAAAVAVDASLRQSTQTLLIHAVDNRFGEPGLDVATCLVNSVAHPIRFPVFASVEDVARSLDREYVKASRRRWLREEQYRRMYLAINRTAHVEALTFNFIRETCAPALRPYLSAAPYVTDIGPVEGMTVSCVADEDRRTLTLSIWHRNDVPSTSAHPWVAERIAAALGSMTAMWHMPIAMAVNEWFGIGPDGARRRGDDLAGPAPVAARAWFLNLEAVAAQSLRGRRFVEPWIAWLIAADVAPGDIVVCADDDTDKTVDLLIACHLAGCGYSVCESETELAVRADSIVEHAAGITVHVIDVAATPSALDASSRAYVAERMDQVARDGDLADKTAYIMATSGSTGQPKLVPVSHGALALFAHAACRAYGWRPQDRILQCAPLTSDISVEEIFAAAICGAEVVRSAAMKSGDIGALVRDVRVLRPTLIDLPTAVWHLLCEDDEALAAIGSSGVRQVIVGGEAIRTRTVEQWLKCPHSSNISIISSYGPTEATVVVTHLPITAADGAGWLRVGSPVVPNTVFVAFGEIVITGAAVSAGYLGMRSESFGVVSTGGGAPLRAFATADRVVFDEDGFPSFAGRRDAIVKIAGRRIDTAAIIGRLAEDPAVADVDVAEHNGALAVWFQAREGSDDTESAARIRRQLVGLGVGSFFVVGVPRIPRMPNGKVDKDGLRTLPQFVEAVPDAAGADEVAAGLARIWSGLLGRQIGAESSLLAEGVGSLDLIRILPATRQHLGRELSVLDLISADSAAYLAAAGATVDELAALDIAADIAADLERTMNARPAATWCGNGSRVVDDGPIVVLGASGIVGTGFARATLELKREGSLRPEVILVTRSELPDGGPWPLLEGMSGVRIARVGTEFHPGMLDELLRVSGASTLVNCIGNTNVLAPYRDIRNANVEWVAAAVDASMAAGTRLIHMSTFVVNVEAAEARVTDPREAVYPYAASKALAELVVAASPSELDFTLVRLPRVLGEAGQLGAGADILVSVVDACIALQAYPSVALTEEVTTGVTAARSILGMAAGQPTLGRGVTVVRGLPVVYADFLHGFGLEKLGLEEWKRQLDRSDWAERNPRRWSVIDAWAGLGLRLGSLTYADYLAKHRTLSLDTASVAELSAIPTSIRDLLVQGCSR